MSFGGGAYDLGFTDRESKIFQDILKYIKEEIQKEFEKGLDTKAEKLLEDFKNNNLENLENKLTQEFMQIPIFSKINVDDFVLMFQNKEHKKFQDIIYKIKKRYEYASSLVDILEEEKFWKSVNHRILKGIDRKNKPVKYRLLKSFKEYSIKPILENFVECKKLKESQEN